MSFPTPLVDIPESEMSETTRAQRDKFVNLGHDIKHLVLTETGEVVFDPALCDIDAFRQAHEKVERDRT